jgi:hypothetical protein
VIPEVSYDTWRAYPERPNYLIRRLACSRCGATLAFQRTDDPDDPYQVWPTRYPFPYETRLRSEMIPFPDIVSVSASGLYVYGQQRALRQGKRARPVKWRQEVAAELPTRQLDIEAFFRDGVSRPLISDEEWESKLRRVRRRTSGSHPRRLPTPDVMHDFIPGDRTTWFNQDAPLPCELFCLNCGVRHLLTGRGPEGAPRDEVIESGLTDERSGWTNLGWQLHTALGPNSGANLDDALAEASGACDPDRILALLEAELARIVSTDGDEAARYTAAIDYVRTNRERIENPRLAFKRVSAIWAGYEPPGQRDHAEHR